MIVFFLVIAFVFKIVFVTLIYISYIYDLAGLRIDNVQGPFMFSQIDCNIVKDWEAPPPHPPCPTLKARI